MFLNRRLQRHGVRAHDLGDSFAVLEQNKSRHGANAELGGDLGEFVDVDFVEVGVVFVGESESNQVCQLRLMEYDILFWRRRRRRRAVRQLTLQLWEQ